MKLRARLSVKVLLISFVTLFILVPYSAYSQDNSTDIALADAGSSVVESPPPAESVQADGLPPEGEASKETTLSTESAASRAASSPMSADSSESDAGSFLSLPNVTTSVFTGAAVVKIPIEVPPGRGGIAPNLTLTYKNLQKNGWVGVGWNLDMGAIQRVTKFGVNYSNPGADCLVIVNGSTSELVPRADWNIGNYLGFGAKIEGQLSKYLFNAMTGGWEVTAKNGTKYFYGESSLSRQDFYNGLRIFKWCLNKVIDTNGSYMKIYYAKDNGEIYLDRIEYTYNDNAPALSWTNYVKFHRELGKDGDVLQIISLLHSAPPLDKKDICHARRELMLLMHFIMSLSGVSKG